MAKQDQPKKSNEMESRDSTPEEIAGIAGALGVSRERLDVGRLGRDVSGSTESDEEVARHQARIRAAELDARTGGPLPDVQIPVGDRVLSADEFQARMLKAMETLSSRQGEVSGDHDLMRLMVQSQMMLAEALTGLKSATLQAAQMQADMQRRVHRPENEFNPKISTFNLRGDKDFPRPRLRCEFFLPWPVTNDQEQLTREEVELLNLLQAGEWTIRRSDRSKLKIEVRQVNKLNSDEPSRVLINHETGFNNDNHRLLPFDWIRQLVSANPKTKALAASVLTMDEEEALILAGQFNDGRQAKDGERLVSVGE